MRNYDFIPPEHWRTLEPGTREYELRLAWELLEDKLAAEEEHETSSAMDHAKEMARMCGAYDETI